jgi:hypothetical protein
MRNWVVLGVVAFGLAQPASAQSQDGRYVGPGKGENAGGQSLVTCPDFDTEVTVSAGKIVGEGRRAVLVNRSVRSEKVPLTGEVSPDGKVTMRIWNLTFRGTLSAGQLTATFRSSECNYRFTLARAG